MASVKLLLLLLLAEGSFATLPSMHHVHSKFEFRHSFKGPYLINSNGVIPFWEFGGSAIPSEDQVRVCPSIKSRRGWVWTKERFSSANWMVDVTLRVTGRLKNGADGMAIWFTAERGSEGPVFGNVEWWHGMGVLLDSFDNDGLHDNPKIQLVLNDGTAMYEHGSDGLRQEGGSCLRDFRNRPNPVKLRIIYLRGALEIWFHDGVSLVEDDYELCLRVEDAQNIPREGYFGVSAATGGLSDDHDVLSFVTHTLTTLEAQQAELQRKVDEERAKELHDQYSQMAAAFEERKDTYYKEHPESAPDWQYEMEVEQNIRVILEMQAQLHNVIRELSAKVDRALGGGAVERRETGGTAGSFSSELNQIKTTESNILHQLADLRAAMDRSVPQGAPVAASEQLQPVYETKTLVQQNRQLLQSIESHLQTFSTHCPPSGDSSCLSPWVFAVVTVTQLVAVVGYLIYRQRQELSAKKFF